MRRGIFSVALAAGLLFGATEASACRIRVLNAATIARSTPVLVMVKTAEWVDPSSWNGWRIVAEGPDGSPTFTFMTKIYSPGCGEPTLPPAGERWVVYPVPGSPALVADAFPLSLAREYDSRLADIPLIPAPAPDAE